MIVQSRGLVDAVLVGRSWALFPQVFSSLRLKPKQHYWFTSYHAAEEEEHGSTTLLGSPSFSGSRVAGLHFVGPLLNLDKAGIAALIRDCWSSPVIDGR